MKFLLTILIALSSTSFAAPAKKDSKTQQVIKSFYAKDEVADITMTTKEASGEVDEKKFQISRLHKKNADFAKIVLTAPKSIAQTTLFVKVQEGEESRWIYLPSQKKVRRLPAGDSNTNIMGSEIYAEDLSMDNYFKTKTRLVKSQPQAGTTIKTFETKFGKDSRYSKILTMVDDKTNFILTAHCFDQKGKKLKVITFKEYEKFGPVFRAQKITVQNVQNKRQTTLALNKIKVNQGLSASDFDPEQMD